MPIDPPHIRLLTVLNAGARPPAETTRRGRGSRTSRERMYSPSRRLLSPTRNFSPARLSSPLRLPAPPVEKFVPRLPTRPFMPLSPIDRERAIRIDSVADMLVNECDHYTLNLPADDQHSVTLTDHDPQTYADEAAKVYAYQSHVIEHFYTEVAAILGSANAELFAGPPTKAWRQTLVTFDKALRGVERIAAQDAAMLKHRWSEGHAWLHELQVLAQQNGGALTLPFRRGVPVQLRTQQEFNATQNFVIGFLMHVQKVHAQVDGTFYELRLADKPEAPSVTDIIRAHMTHLDAILRA